jgi:hypothetical protein
MAVYDDRRLPPSHPSLLDETTNRSWCLPCTTQKIEVEEGSDSMKLPSGSDIEQMIHLHQHKPPVRSVHADVRGHLPVCPRAGGTPSEIESLQQGCEILGP